MGLFLHNASSHLSVIMCQNSSCAVNCIQKCKFSDKLLYFNNIFAYFCHQYASRSLLYCLVARNLKLPEFLRDLSHMKKCPYKWISEYFSFFFFNLQYHFRLNTPVYTNTAKVPVENCGRSAVAIEQNQCGLHIPDLCSIFTAETLAFSSRKYRKQSMSSDTGVHWSSDTGVY